MRRLAMTAALGVIAFAVPGTAPSTGASRAGADPRPLFAGASAATLPRLPSLAERADVEGPPEPTPPSLQRDAGVTRRASRDDTGGRSSDAIWAALAACESNGNPRAVSAGGRYFGAFQFSPATWHSLGYGGSPADHSYADQLTAAKRLQARNGWAQWPACARHLGLR